MKFTNYGRRILMWQNKHTFETKYTLSGQWVGHLYGDEWGTQRQRQNASPGEGWNLIAISEKIFWNMNGYVGDEVENGFALSDYAMIYNIDKE